MLILFLFLPSISRKPTNLTNDEGASPQPSLLENCKKARVLCDYDAIDNSELSLMAEEVSQILLIYTSLIIEL